MANIPDTTGDPIPLIPEASNFTPRLWHSVSANLTKSTQFLLMHGMPFVTPGHRAPPQPPPWKSEMSEMSPSVDGGAPPGMMASQFHSRPLDPIHEHLACRMDSVGEFAGEDVKVITSLGGENPAEIIP